LVDLFSPPARPPRGMRLLLARPPRGVGLLLSLIHTSDPSSEVHDLPLPHIISQPPSCRHRHDGLPPPPSPGHGRLPVRALMHISASTHRRPNRAVAGSPPSAPSFPLDASLPYCRPTQPPCVGGVLLLDAATSFVCRPATTPPSAATPGTPAPRIGRLAIHVGVATGSSTPRPLWSSISTSMQLLRSPSVCPRRATFPRVVDVPTRSASSPICKPCN
jgi:hypothetical protein